MLKSLANNNKNHNAIRAILTGTTIVFTLELAATVFKGAIPDYILLGVPVAFGGFLWSYITVEIVKIVYGRKANKGKGGNLIAVH